MIEEQLTKLQEFQEWAIEQRRLAAPSTVQPPWEAWANLIEAIEVVIEFLVAQGDV